MARKKKRASRKTSAKSAKSTPSTVRPTWKGNISFGLVNVPVVLYPAERRVDINFHLIDSRNSARIRYERVNEETGQEVPWDKVVKGYEFSKGNYVLLSDEELERASVEMTRTIEIEQFVELSEIAEMYFDRPYYLVPDKRGEKGYVLLREALVHSGKAGISRVVIRAREHLAALFAHGDALVLDLLRFPQELRALDDFEFPSGSLQDYKITKQEVAMAGQLVDGLTADWEPQAFHDQYRDSLMKLIDKKIESGRTKTIVSEPEEEEAAAEPQTVNFMEALKKSVEQTSHGKRSRRKGTKSGRARAPRKKRAG